MTKHRLRQIADVSFYLPYLCTVIRKEWRCFFSFKMKDMKELVLPPAWAYDHFNERGDSVLRFKNYVSTPHATYLVSDEGSMLVRLDPTNRKGKRYRVQKPNFETRCQSPFLLDAEGKRKGYEKYIYHQKDKFIRFYLHRAVAICWVQKRDLFCTEVDHIDDNRFNNRAKNLRWVTRAENNPYNKHKNKHNGNNKERTCSASRRSQTNGK